jgi:uncharacterized membrane protein
MEKKENPLKWLIVGFLFPPVGMILYIVWDGTTETNGAAAGVGAFIAFVLLVILGAI